VLSAVDGSRKITKIKAVRTSTGLGLREAKAIVDGPPGMLRTRTGEEAEALKVALEALGATAEIRTPAAEPNLAVVSPPDAGIADELARLADLHRDGSLDDAEFAAPRARSWTVSERAAFGAGCTCKQAARGGRPAPLPDKLTPHSLRRTFCSLLYALGEDPSTVMDEMGHTDPGLALRFYRQAMRRGADEKAQLKSLVEGADVHPPGATAPRADLAPR
jgi:ribosomal L7/L12-like protein